MSELKGQLLGIVLVVAVFGAVSTVLIEAFKNAGNKIAKKIEDVDNLNQKENEKSKSKYNFINLLKY
ncbi:MAG: hypothetical protein ACTTID_02475 [Bacillales bacterium]